MFLSLDFNLNLYFLERALSWDDEVVNGTDHLRLEELLLGEIVGVEAELQRLREEAGHIVVQQLAVPHHGVVLDEVKVKTFTPRFQNELVEGWSGDLAVHSNDVVYGLRDRLTANRKIWLAGRPPDGPIILSLKLSAHFLAFRSFSGLSSLLAS